MTGPDPSQTYYTGSICQVDWSGGNEQGQVSLYIRKDSEEDLVHGRGLPENGIPTNPSSFEWNIPYGFSSGSYRIYIFSSTDRTNYAWSHQAFSIVNRNVDFYKWQASPWSLCSKACGFGTKERSVACVNAVTNQEVDPGFCNTYARPSTSQSCNIFGCQDSCPSVSAVFLKFLHQKMRPGALQLTNLSTLLWTHAIVFHNGLTMTGTFAGIEIHMVAHMAVRWLARIIKNAVKTKGR
eukprot:1162086-Pelagomonas_calceolata.AAC.1